MEAGVLEAVPGLQGQEEVVAAYDCKVEVVK